MAHLLAHDSVFGRLPQPVAVTDRGIVIDNDELRILADRDPKAVPWDEPLVSRLGQQSAGSVQIPGDP